MLLGPGRGQREELWTWDICTIATESGKPKFLHLTDACNKLKRFD